MFKKSIVLTLFALSGLGIGAGGAYAREHDFFARRFWLYFEAEESQDIQSSGARQESVASSTDVAVPVLVYHSIRPITATDSRQLKDYSVEPAVFEAQLQYLKDHGYTAISLAMLGDRITKSVPLPEKSVVLTIDDGWENQYVYAFPLLKKFGMSATFFIFTNAMGHKHFLTWEQVRDMAMSGMEIGGHTQSHPYLIKITDSKKLVEEVAGGKKIIEDHIGRAVTVFAYPFGEYNDATIGAVKGAGYRVGRTTHRGMVHNARDIYTLRAMQVQDSMESLITVLRGL